MKFNYYFKDANYVNKNCIFWIITVLLIIGSIIDLNKTNIAISTVYFIQVSLPRLIWAIIFMKVKYRVSSAEKCFKLRAITLSGQIVLEIAFIVSFII